MTRLFILEDRDEFKLVDSDGNVLATEKKSAALSTDSSGHEHDEKGRFTGIGADKSSKEEAIQTSKDAAEATKKLKPIRKAGSKAALDRAVMLLNSLDRIDFDPDIGSLHSQHSHAASVHDEIKSLLFKSGHDDAAMQHHKAKELHLAVAAELLKGVKGATGVAAARSKLI